MEQNRNYTDLHRHLDGSISLPLANKLASMQGMKTYTEKELKDMMTVPKDCRDLNEYLTKFDYPLSLLQTPAALAVSVSEVLMEAKDEGVTLVELRFAPQLHTHMGMSQRGIIENALRGLHSVQDACKANNEDFKAGLILCCMRGDDNAAANEETVALASEYLDQGVIAVDLAGAEGLYPTEQFADLFAKAKALNVPVTIHAGEAAGPESIACALDMGASRIGHGIRCVEDEALMKRLAEEKITLELCPTSNLNTKVCGDIHEYPIRKLMEAGVPFCINTDNTTVSDTNIIKEYDLLKAAFDLTEDEIDTIIENGRAATFIK